MSYRTISLRPYPGKIYLFRDIPAMRRVYERMTRKKYPYEDGSTAGRYVRLNARSTVWLVYARQPHQVAHEFAHVLLHTFTDIGCDPAAGNGEPFCYMLSQLMIEA